MTIISDYYNGKKKFEATDDKGNKLTKEKIEKSKENVTYIANGTTIAKDAPIEKVYKDGKNMYIVICGSSSIYNNRKSTITIFVNM